MTFAWFLHVYIYFLPLPENNCIKPCEECQCFNKIHLIFAEKWNIQNYKYGTRKYLLQQENFHCHKLKKRHKLSSTTQKNIVDKIIVNSHDILDFPKNTVAKSTLIMVIIASTSCWQLSVQMWCLNIITLLIYIRPYFISHTEKSFTAIFWLLYIASNAYIIFI